MIQKRCREELICEHRYLCRRAARRFIRPGLDRADLEQVAAIGLIKAADRYDRSQATPFEAYAWLLILGELMHHVRDSERLLRAPRRVRDLERRWNAAERDLSALLGREPHDCEVARFVNATPAEQREIREYRASSYVLSFDSSEGWEQRASVGTFEEVTNRLTVERALSTLPPLEQRIVRSIHLEGVSVVELAKRLGYSRRHVTRLHRDAMQRLKNAC
ncbi:MAG TPA: sigma-70 family RNA polymerase sigma factor [Candidatus Baltobacteraceae bacterium]|nr:sigma-70 family RNA polymerase sigma factor [Candidatus Baltobacteraceae bacterium]